MWLLSLGLGCVPTDGANNPRSRPGAEDTGPDGDDTGAAVHDTADASGAETGRDTGETDTAETEVVCSDRAPEAWLGCVVTGELSEWYDGERLTRLDFEAATPAACDELGCAWQLATTCVLHPTGGTVGEGPCELFYYPDGVTGTGLGEVGTAFDGTRTCLLGAVAEGGALTLSTRPEGAEVDAEAGGYGMNSCTGGGPYDATGTLALE
jgi:hypothetical protein